MPARDLHLTVCDITEPRRLNAALKFVRAHAIGKQKSVHEFFPMLAEPQKLMEDMSVIDMDTGRFLRLRLDPRSRVLTVGEIGAPAAPDGFHAGSQWDT